MKHLFWAAAALVAAIFAAEQTHAANCSSYPYTLTNGQTADATQVMANFNTILSCANTNLAHNGANADITSLSALSTPLSQSQGGTGLTSLTGAVVTNWLADSNVTNAKLANMANQTFKGNVSGSSAAPSDVSSANVEAAIQTYLPFEFYVFVGGLTGNAWILADYVPSTNVILVTGKSACKYGTAATNSTTYTLKDNGSSIGTVVFTNANCTITVTSSPYTVTAGHALTISGPTTGDTTLADIGITFGGTRN